MINEVQAIILGIIQGITEFLPISSSAHLNIFPELLNWPASSLTFDIFIHLGTLLAVIYYFRDELLLLIKRDTNPSRRRWFTLKHIIISTLAVAPIALLIEFFNNPFHDFGISTVIMLILFGIPMIFIESIQKRCKSNPTSLSTKNAIVIGLAQGIALINGVSRSGITIMSAMAMGYTKDKAKQYSFIISIPVIIMAVLSTTKILFTNDSTTSIENPMIMLVGAISSFISGYLAIRFLMSYLNKHSLAIFGYYRIILAIILIFIFYT